MAYPLDLLQVEVFVALDVHALALVVHAVVVVGKEVVHLPHALDVERVDVVDVVLLAPLQALREHRLGLLQVESLRPTESSQVEVVVLGVRHSQVFPYKFLEAV